MNAEKITATNNDILNQVNFYGQDYDTAGDTKDNIHHQPLPNIGNKMFDNGSTNSTFNKTTAMAQNRLGPGPNRFVYTSDASMRRNIGNFNTNQMYKGRPN
jgi:hypothetical protein